jgi:hypothetical protein
MIAGGRARRIFRSCAEEELRRVVHWEMLRRKGLVPDDGSKFPERSDGTSGNFWAIDPAQETINRNEYHGLRRLSLCVINRLIVEALEEAAEPEALKQARRFPLRHRYEIYRAAATSHRFLQLTSVFPVLAVAILRGRRNSDRFQAPHLVEIGAPLRRIADLMDVPMVLRKVKPGVAHWAFGMEETLAQNPGLIDAYMPQSLPRMRVWLKAVRFALSVSSDFGEFIAKHATEVGATAVEASIWIEDAADWARACLPARGQTPGPGAEFVTRQFSPGMSVKTVTALTHEWLEAVASNMTGPSYEFPEPWAQPGKMGDYEIMPITNSGDLYREGNAMHHCAGTYGESVREGRCYIYSLRKDEARVATIELIQFDGRVDIGQIRGSCNRSVPREIELAAQNWLKSQKTFRLPKKLIRPGIFVPPENPAPRPIIVPPENQVPEQIIGLAEQQAHSPNPIVSPLATAEPDSSDGEEFSYAEYRMEWERNWSQVIPFEDFVQLLDEGQIEFLCSLREPDFFVNTDEYYEPDRDPEDEADFAVEDDIDGTIDAAFAEIYHIGDKEYDEDKDDEFVTAQSRQN